MFFCVVTDGFKIEMEGRKQWRIPVPADGSKQSHEAVVFGSDLASPYSVLQASAGVQ